MKKIVLFFAVIVLCSLTIKAQLNKNRDFAPRDLINRLIINHDTRNISSQGLKAAEFQKLDSAVTPNTVKDYYIYDNERRNTHHISYVWQNQRWVNADKEEYSYDINGKLSVMTGYTWNAASSQWELSGKNELTYSNNLISSLLFSEWKNNQWIKIYKIDYTYNANGNYTNQIGYTWNATTSQWENFLKFEYEYDVLNRLILNVDWMWSNGNWANTSKTTYSYDSNGNMNLSDDYRWDSTTSAWILANRSEYSYDANKRPLSTIESFPVGGVIWMNRWKIDYTYSYTVAPDKLILPFFGENFNDQYFEMAASYTEYQWNMYTNNWDFSSKNDKYFSDFVLNAPLLFVSTNAMNIGSAANSTNTFDITSNLSWTAARNQSWLTISDETGTGNKKITLTAAANPTATPRTALVTVSATGVPSQNIVVTQAAPGLQLTVLLEGAYAGAGLMNTALITDELVPLSQPYNVAPWNYAGTETVTSVPAGVVDWVLVELRQAATPAEALPGTKLPGWPKACFVKSNGSIVAPDGTLPALGNPVITSNLYVIIRHRNHVAIMSATGMTLTGTNYVYNFTDAITKAYGSSAGYKEIGTGVFGMVSGDPDADGEISVLDFSKWATDFGKTFIYLPSDIDTDGEISVLDYSKWATNFGIGNIPPLKKLSPDGSGRKYTSQVPVSK